MKKHVSVAEGVDMRFAYASLDSRMHAHVPLRLHTCACLLVHAQHMYFRDICERGVADDREGKRGKRRGRGEGESEVEWAVGNGRTKV